MTGTGREVLSASVELIIDNSDKRFQSDGDVSIKRSIGLKKDEYFIDNKHCSKQEIINIYESVGLSRSNPYYIVEQGKISALIRMKDAERLDLLREIAGTKTYDERKKESLKIMKDTDYKLTQINDVIIFLNERIDELSGEKDELIEYQTLDNQRRAYEYCIYDHELQNAVHKLEQMEVQRNNNDDQANKIYLEINEISKLKTDTTNHINELNAELLQQQNILKQYSTARRQLIEDRTRLELSIHEYNVSNEYNLNELNQMKLQLHSINEQIMQVELQLSDATQQYNHAVQNELLEQSRANDCDVRLQQLFIKQNNKNQYKTRKQRDTALQKQIDSLNNNINDINRQIESLQDERTSMQSTIESTETLITQHQSIESDLTRSMENDQYQYNVLKTERNTLIDSIKDNKNKLYDIQKQYNSIDTKLQNAEHTFNKSIDINSLNGMNTLKQVVQRYNIQGVYGQIIDLFTADHTFYKCIEVTTRNSLFHVCVENDTIASTIIQYIQSDDLRGRLTFIPFNQITRQQPIQYPDSSDILPMINKLKFDMKYRPAIQQIFGDTVIARDLTVASNMALQHNLNAITLHGDQIDRNGGITGGMIADKSGNKIANYMHVKQLRNELAELLQQKNELDNTVKQLDSQLQSVEKQITQLIHKRSIDKESIMDAHKQILSSQATLKSLQLQMNDIEVTFNKLHDNKQSIQQQVTYNTNEIQSLFTSELTAEETNELNQCIQQQSTIKSHLVRLHGITVACEIEKNKFESQLNDNLFIQKSDLQQSIQQYESDTSNQIRSDQDNDKLQRYTAQIHDMDVQIRSIKKEYKDNASQLNQLQSVLDEYINNEAMIKNRLNSMSSNLDTLLNKKQLYQRKKDECQKLIKDLSTISIELIHQYKNMDNKKLIHELQKCNNKLVQLKHVNKKAVTQYNLFVEQKSTLHQRQNELQHGRSAILQLMQHLDMKKDEAINRTFKAIAKHFTIVFAELVPGMCL